MWHQTHNQVKNLQQEKKIVNPRIFFAMDLGSSLCCLDLY